MTQLRHIPEHLAGEALALWFKRPMPEDEGPPEYLIRCALEVVDRWFDGVLLDPGEFPRPAIPDAIRANALTEAAERSARGVSTKTVVEVALDVVDAWISAQWVTWFERYEGLEQRKNVRMEECLRALVNPAYHFGDEARKAMIQRALSDIDEQGFPK